MVHPVSVGRPHGREQLACCSHTDVTNTIQPKLSEFKLNVIGLCDRRWSLNFKALVVSVAFFGSLAPSPASSIPTRKLRLSAARLQSTGFGEEGSKPRGAPAHRHRGPLTLPANLISLSSSKGPSYLLLQHCPWQQMGRPQ